MQSSLDRLLRVRCSVYECTLALVQHDACAEACARLSAESTLLQSNLQPMWFQSCCHISRTTPNDGANDFISHTQIWSIRLSLALPCPQAF